MDRVPEVTRDDVLRIVRRDYPSDDQVAVMSHLGRYGRESWQGEQHRVQLAILKLSRGDLSQLHNYVDVARQDHRDVIGPAEYPCSFQLTVAGNSDAERGRLAELQQEDWQQYDEWLRSDLYCGGPRGPLVAGAETDFLQGPARRRRRLPGWAAPILGAFVGMLLV